MVTDEKLGCGGRSLDSPSTAARCRCAMETDGEFEVDERGVEFLIALSPFIHFPINFFIRSITSAGCASTSLASASTSSPLTGSSSPYFSH